MMGSYKAQQTNGHTQQRESSPEAQREWPAKAAIEAEVDFSAFRKLRLELDTERPGSQHFDL
jgi:hypothetical protein